MWGGKDGVISNKLGNMAHSFLRYTNQPHRQALRLTCYLQ